MPSDEYRKLLFRLHFVDLSSLATCTHAEFNRSPPLYRLDPSVKRRRGCRDSRLIHYLD
ncbi:hypothetical protein DAPPUDRAFT_306499 [Daphnia pulex]|uniref:Uncharacterized protein n=1 Tax=Daphnia pulex TaxID=6669 RepID=E9FYD3_DAPPU|nr:hypothetical protein DAPPUDRAFT_306499 [Daphnia pulex]|eukprot:EFX87791.1 hypothetical protein DAPPUDRAFT_306499 [Daphnia pulex]